MAGTQVAAAADVSGVYINGVLTPTILIPVVASSAGATTIIAATAAKSLLVLALQLATNAPVNVKWQSHVIPTDVTGLAYYGLHGGEVLPFNQGGWFKTIAGEALDINLSGAVAVGGSLTYVLV